MFVMKPPRCDGEQTRLDKVRREERKREKLEKKERMEEEEKVMGVLEKVKWFLICFSLLFFLVLQEMASWVGYVFLEVGSQVVFCLFLPFLLLLAFFGRVFLGSFSFCLSLGVWAFSARF